MVSATARCYGEIAGGAVANLDLLISSALTSFITLNARARALLARPWSARCYGVARPREGSRQNSIGGSGVLSLRHFGLVLFIPWRVGAEESAAAKDGFGRRGIFLRSCRRRVAVANLDFTDFLRVNRFHHPQRAREGAAGQAVVCPLLRGSSPTRGVAPKQHRGARACFHSGISGWFSLSLNPRARGCPKNLPRRKMVSAGAMLRRDCRRRHRPI